jgi:hypothetical protein
MMVGVIASVYGFGLVASEEGLGLQLVDELEM